jgi:hypothetical protein
VLGRRFFSRVCFNTAMSKAAKPAKTEKEAKGIAAVRAAAGPKPRSAEKDFWVFTCGVGSLIYVLVTMVPN